MHAQIWEEKSYVFLFFVTDGIIHLISTVVLTFYSINLSINLSVQTDCLYSLQAEEFPPAG